MNIHTLLTHMELISMNLIEELNLAFFRFLTTTFCCNNDQLSTISLTLNTYLEKQAFGDVTSNAALILAKQLRKNPREIAQAIVDQFSNERVKKIDIAGQGFLNFFLTDTAYQIISTQLFEHGEQFFKPDALTIKHYSVEFVSANPTGPLHIGHGRGGIIGDVLGNVLTFIGHTVTKEFYINDAGGQIQKLGTSFKIRCEQLLGETTELPENGYHGEYLKTLAQVCVTEHGTALLTYDEQFFYTYAQTALLEQIKSTLSAYGIDFTVWFSEKTLHESGQVATSIETLTKNGYTYEKDGALWFRSQQFGDDKDRVLQRETGEPTYIAADVAYLRDKFKRGAQQLIMVLGQDHHSYVVRLKGILQALGRNPEDLEVILYQLVTVKKSDQIVRLSKRTGAMITLIDIINTVGTDVARFFYLNKKAEAHLEFNIDLALKHSDENPVYYIQYAYVRTGSILSKAAEHPQLRAVTPQNLDNFSNEEKLLIKKIVSLQSLLATIAHTHHTHSLTYYVLELAQLLHSYYNKQRVIDLQQVAQSRSRLIIIQLVRNTIGTCLTLLGISRPERM